MNKKVVLGSRIFLGLIFFVFGLNGFLNFLPMPPLPEAAGQFMGAFAATGYMFPMIKGLEVLAGLMLLAGVQVPLALLLLAPIAVNIFTFHFFLTGVSTVGLPVLIGVLMLVVARGHWASFRGIFAQPPREAV